MRPLPNLDPSISPLIIDNNEQMFLGSSDKVYILDKVEGNPTKINGHPAFASVWCVHFPPFARVLSIFGTGI